MVPYHVTKSEAKVLGQFFILYNYPFEGEASSKQGFCFGRLAYTVRISLMRFLNPFKHVFKYELELESDKNYALSFQNMGRHA